jgi:hypothetical protein
MSVRFDKATSGANRLTCTAAIPPPGSGITFTAWVYFVTGAQASPNGWSDLLRIHNGAGANTTLTLGALASGTAMGLYSASGTATGPTMTAGNWYRVGYTLTGTSGKLYMIGATGTTVLYTATITPGGTPTGCTFGARSPTDATEYCDMRLSQARIWSSVLTQAQIEAEWASTTPVVTAALFANWPLTVATDLTDHSGNVHHLVANATTPATEAEPPNGPTFRPSSFFFAA